MPAQFFNKRLGPIRSNVDLSNFRMKNYCKIVVEEKMRQFEQITGKESCAKLTPYYLLDRWM